jgi:hypothetical protein
VKHAVWLCAAVLCIAAEPGRAVIDPAHCTVPPFIRIVGVSDPVNVYVDPTGAFQVFVADENADPIHGAVVRLRFGDCTDMRLCSVQDAASFNCAALDPWVEMTTQTGTAGFVILGGGRNPGTATSCATVFPGPGLNCIRVEADDGSGFVEIGRATAVHYDQNGVQPSGNGVTPVDLAVLKNDVGLALLGCGYKGRGDLSMDGALSPVDLSFHKTVIGNSGLGIGSGGGCHSVWGPVPYCP